jgi:hypothetical protein
MVSSRSYIVTMDLKCVERGHMASNVLEPPVSQDRLHLPSHTCRDVRQPFVAGSETLELSEVPSGPVLPVL